jgi:2-keto-4-pentenoate hydratase
MNARTESIAHFLWDARCRRQKYANLPDSLRPTSIHEAYAAQEEYWRLAEPVYGSVAGVKVATTTKVMQQVMGITHPCAGAIFSKTIHHSATRISKSEFVNLRLECEIALQLAADMPAGKAPWTAESVVRFVAGASAAYELIEDRNAIYSETPAVSLIAENCWNGGVVLGPVKAVHASEIIGVRGRRTLNGNRAAEGEAENPYATLAWLANLLAERRRDLKAGMIVITGSLMPTFSVSPGDSTVFTVDGLGEAVIDVV